MRLKYKKIILLTTMSIMGIGLLTLSVSNDKTQAKENDAAFKEVSAAVDTLDKADDTISVVPTEVPTPTTIPIYDIEEDAYPEITKLFTDFYAAKSDRDVDKIKALLSNPTEADTQEKLQKKTEYIEDYLNIKTYTKKGFQEGTYIVYVYHEIKFTVINTPAPGLSKFYVVTGEDGKIKIFSGDLEEATKTYYDERNNDADVVKIIELTNKKSEKAIEKDEDLKEFWESIQKASEKSDTPTKEASAE